MNFRPAFLVWCGALGIFVSRLDATEWSRWRGPNGNSISDENLRVNPWPVAGPPRLWTNQVGTGMSSIAVSQGRLFTLGNSNDTDTVWCLSSDDGRVLWSYSYACPLDPNLYEGGPSATPTVDGDRVFTLSKSGHLFCFDASSGAIRWRTNFITDLGLRSPIWGFAGSPLILDEKLIFNAGGHGLAFNKTNGTVLWLSNTNRCGYSSPVPYSIGSTQAVVMFSERRVVGTRVSDGALLWNHTWATANDMNIPDITLFNGDFLVTSFNRSAALLNVLGSSSALVWTRSGFSTVLSPGVLLGNYLYAFHSTTDTPGEGELKCLDMTSGTVAWATNMWVGSLISADGKLIILAGNGDLVLAEANPAAYVELARAPVLDGRCWTPPAFSGGRLYCRNAAGDVVALALTSAPGTSPRLQITQISGTQRLRLAWPTNLTGSWLESSDRLTAGWVEITNPPVIQGNLNVHEMDPAGSVGFFRLRNP